MKTIDKILSFGKGEFTVGNLLAAVLVFLICAVVISIILKIVRRIGEKSKVDNSAIGFILAVAKIGLYFIALIIACDCIGIPVSSLLAVLSIAGLAISLSVQDVLSNLISGFVILFTKPFAGGDFIEVSGKSGNVQAIGFMHTTLATPDNKVILIPNHEITVSSIINYTNQNIRRVDLTVSASYKHTANEVRASVNHAFAKTKGVINDPAPFVGVKEYGSSAISYEVRAWCNSADYWDVYFGLNEALKICFDEDGIEMTFDHLNVHMVDK